MTRILKSFNGRGMESSVDEKQYEYAYTLLGPCTSTIAQVCTKKIDAVIASFVDVLRDLISSQKTIRLQFSLYRF